MTEDYATNIFLFAIKNGQAAELLTTLFEGGGFTLDAEAKRLVMLPKSFFNQEIEEPDGAPLPTSS